MKILVYFWWASKNSWQLHEGHDGEIDGLGSKIGPKPTSRAFDWCNNNGGVPL